MVDQDVSQVVEERGFKLAVILDSQNLDIDAIVLRSHFSNAIDDRRSIIVPIRNSYSVHRPSQDYSP
jgi:hypothetical protein